MGRGWLHPGEKGRWLPAATVLGLQLRPFKRICMCMGQIRTPQQELLLLLSHSLLGPLAMLLPLKSKQASKQTSCGVKPGQQRANTSRAKSSGNTGFHRTDRPRKLGLLKETRHDSRKQVGSSSEVQQGGRKSCQYGTCPHIG